MVRRIDTRDLEHPEPLEMMTRALKDNTQNVTIVMIHHREPFPLYELATTMGYHYRATRESDAYHIEFSR